MSALIKKNWQNILKVSLLVLAIPLIGIVMNVIYIYGAYVGTHARTFLESGICK